MVYYLVLIPIVSVIIILYVFFSEQIRETYKKKMNPDGPDKIPQIIVTYKGDKYNITNFIKKHPGGKTVLINNNGNDIEKLMLENEHSESAYKILERYKIL